LSFLHRQIGRGTGLAQLGAIGYLAKISSIRLNAFSAAACGVMPPWMISIQPWLQVCSFETCA